MQTKSVIVEDDILKEVTEKSFARGMNYYDSGMVESAIQRGTRLFFEVLGSEWEPYRVGVALQENGFTASCTCPYDWEGYCKHVVASLLTFIHDRDSITVGAPIEDLLSKLNSDELKTLVIRIVESDPEMIDVIEPFCDRSVAG